LVHPEKGKPKRLVRDHRGVRGATLIVQDWEGREATGSFATSAGGWGPPQAASRGALGNRKRGITFSAEEMPKFRLREGRGKTGDRRETGVHPIAQKRRGIALAKSSKVSPAETTAGRVS